MARWTVSKRAFSVRGLNVASNELLGLQTPRGIEVAGLLDTYLPTIINVNLSLTFERV